MKKRHQQLSLLSMQGYGCSNPPLWDLVKVVWLLAGLGHECRPCFQTPSPPLLKHTLPGRCSLWPLCWAPNAPHCTVIYLAAYLCNFLKRNFMSGLYGSQFPIRPFSSGVEVEARLSCSSNALHVLFYWFFPLCFFKACSEAEASMGRCICVSADSLPLHLFMTPLATEHTFHCLCS